MEFVFFLASAVVAGILLNVIIFAFLAAVRLAIGAGRYPEGEGEDEGVNADEWWNTATDWTDRHY